MGTSSEGPGGLLTSHFFSSGFGATGAGVTTGAAVGLGGAGGAAHDPSATRTSAKRFMGLPSRPTD